LETDTAMTLSLSLSLVVLALLFTGLRATGTAAAPPSIPHFAAQSGITVTIGGTAGSSQIQPLLNALTPIEGV